MKAEERREDIARTLTSSKPISAAALAQRFSVSRQIIVGDIALLRASGLDIVATPRGYKLGESSGLIRAVVCVHETDEDMERELLTMVDNGCTVMDVVVEHPLYGEITGQLSLSSLTGGLHLHNLRCPDEAAYGRVCQTLEKLGLLYSDG